jgi:60 kDa SS-A/Ro ribonucleoprotein
MNKEIKLRDAMFLTHPSPVDTDEAHLFEKIANNTLKTPDTWEVSLSKADNVSKKEKWERLIDEGKLGYMAALRNLRNIVEANVYNLNKVLEQIQEPENVIKSKQFPFRFLSAWKAVEELPTFMGEGILDSLENAIRTSVCNIKGFHERDNIYIAIDTSGSMTDTLSEKSEVTYMDVAMVMGMLLKTKCDKVISGIFGDDYMTINLPSRDILMNVDKLKRLEGKVGHSTNGYLAIEYLIRNKLMADKVMMFTDCQLWDSYEFWNDRGIDSYWHEYKKINPKAELYLFDMAGYGDTPISIQEPGVYLIAGWSEKIFDILEAIKNGGNALNEIDKIRLN